MGKKGMGMEYGNNPGDMSPEVKSYQPSEKEFAGKEFGKANDYIERKEKQMSRDAGEIRRKAYKGRYE
jgi:hypothetical protein